MTAADELQRESTDVLRELVRFNTVNPPGNERPAIEFLASYLRDAGFRTELLAADEDRPNLVADLAAEQDGQTLCYLGHVDTVLADPSEWSHDPWSGDVVDGYLWGRGALDMKSQVAAEAVAAARLARGGWRPASGALRLVFVCDEETGGDLGAHWLTDTHPDRVRCDMLLNEGGAARDQLEAEDPLLGAAHAVAAPAAELEHLTSTLVEEHVAADAVGVGVGQPVGADIASGLLVGHEHELQAAVLRSPPSAREAGGGDGLGGHLRLHVERAAAP